MEINLTKPAEKLFQKLPAHIKQKAKKQLILLAKDHTHPSLHIKKMKNSELYEGRIDIHYRFRFLWEKDQAYIVSIGQHDAGLGIK